MIGLQWTRTDLWPFLLLLPVLWWLLYFALGTRRRRARAYGMPGGDPTPAPALRACLLTLLAALGHLTWMDPLHGEERLPVARRGLDLVFCLDVSRSMLAQDLKPSRLERAKQDIATILPSLVGGDRLALVVFAGKARRRIPLTHDLDAFRQLLDEIDTDTVRYGGTDLAAALILAAELIPEDHRATSAVVVLSDGEDHGGQGHLAAADLAALGIPVHAVAYGTTGGGKILLPGNTGKFLEDGEGSEVVSTMNPDGLDALARAGGGVLVRADAMGLPLRELVDMRLLPRVRRDFEAGEESRMKTRYQWLLLPVLLLLLWDLHSARGRPR